MRIELCTEIPAAPQAVWNAIEDPASHTAWMADAAEIRFVSDQRRGVGTEFDCLTVVGPLRTTDRMTVTEWEPPVAMGIAHRGAVHGQGRFTLAPAPRGTRFCWSEDLRFPWWLGGRVGEIGARPVLRRVWRRNLERLRRYVVAVSGPGTTPFRDPVP